jgi:hypothetical protein
MTRRGHRDKEQIQVAGCSFGKKITKLLTKKKNRQSLALQRFVLVRQRDHQTLRRILYFGLRKMRGKIMHIATRIKKDSAM